MKKMSFVLLAVACITQSCGPRKVAENSNFKNKVISSAFSDFKSPSTLDMKELIDLPRVVDLKNDMTIVKDQGDRSTCVAFSIIGLVEAAIKKDFKIETNLSEEYSNYQTKKSGAYSNMEESNETANLRELKKSGMLLESDWPYQSSWFENGLPCSQFKSSDKTAPKNCFSHNAPTEDVMKRIITTENIEVIRIPSNTNEVIKFLAVERRPLTLGLVINNNGWPDSGDVFYNDALREECLKNPDACGSHAVILTGYDLDKKLFFFKNSRGVEWGNKGYGTVPFDTLDRFSGGIYFSVKFKAAPKLPKKATADNLNLKQFSVQSKLESNQSLSIKVTGEVQGTRGHFMYVSSFLVKQPATTREAPNDGNIEPVLLSEENVRKYNDTVVRSVVYFLPEFQNDDLRWDINAPLNLDIPAGIMNIPEVTSILSSATYKVFLRTTIYSFSDIGGAKVLRRIYSPLNGQE